MLSRPTIIALLSVLFLNSLSLLETDAEEPLSRIMIGSCCRQGKPQPIWYSIVRSKPDLFLFIGDNIYGDSEDMEVLRAKYAMLGAEKGYQKLLETCPLLAVWDDHDFGVNDGGLEYPKKAESQAVFNEFYKTPADSPRRKRPGIYDAQIFGPEGKRVQVILLDTRYFRSPLKKRPAEERKEKGPFMPTDDIETTMLGEAQWKWLEGELRKPAELRIVASSIQFLAEQHGWEKWSNFPHEQKRMFDLISETKANGVLFISGDRHLAEIAKRPKTSVGYPIYDLTSSSLNVASGGNQNEKNRYRVGDHYRALNFGGILIDWAKEDPTVSLNLYDLEGDIVREHAFPLSELQH